MEGSPGCFARSTYAYQNYLLSPSPITYEEEFTNYVRYAILVCYEVGFPIMCYFGIPRYVNISIKCIEYIVYDVSYFIAFLGIPIQICVVVRLPTCPILKVFQIF
mgnify:CR=1 FL=1